MTLEILAPQQSAAALRIAATPTMPAINCSARIRNYTGGSVTFNWTVVINWAGNGAATNGRFTGSSTARNSDATNWQVPFNNQFFGGDVSVSVEARTQQGATHRAQITPFRILGTQPAEATILAAVGNAPWYARRIARHEAGLLQFDAAGNPLLNTLGDGGAGIMQITGANQTAQDVWNWRTNIATGLRLLNNQAQTAQTFWTRQVNQFNAWNAAHPQAGVAAPANVTYNNVTFSFQPTGAQHSFADAIAIKMFNGAVTHFIVWYNVGAHATNPVWRINDTNNLGRNYVRAVCQTNP